MKWASVREANRRRWPFHHNRTANKEERIRSWLQFIIDEISAEIRK
jgi:hypothetical protein